MIDKEQESEILKSKAMISVTMKMRELKYFKGPISVFMRDELKIKNKNIKPYSDAFELLIQYGYIKNIGNELLWQDDKGTLKFGAKFDELINSNQDSLIKSIRKKKNNKKSNEDYLLDTANDMLKSGDFMTTLKQKNSEGIDKLIQDTKKNKIGNDVIDEISKMLGKVPMDKVAKKIATKKIKKLIKKHYFKKQNTNDNTDEALKYIEK